MCIACVMLIYTMYGDRHLYSYKTARFVCVWVYAHVHVPVCVHVFLGMCVFMCVCACVCVCWQKHDVSDVVWGRVVYGLHKI